MNLQNKKVLVNGCSFSRGPISWPYFLQKKCGFELTNLAQAGAGNDYICHSTMSELSSRRYDLVLIMWSGIDRHDIRVEDISQFDKTPYTSGYQLTRNDWPEKIIHPINDQDYVEPNWVFGVGFINGDKPLINTGLFNNYYKYVGRSQNISRCLVSIIAVQSLLKQLEIPYAFMFFQDYIDELSTDNKYKLLDQNNLITGDNIFSIAKNHNDFEPDGVHPAVMSNELWADHVKDFLQVKFQ